MAEERRIYGTPGAEDLYSDIDEAWSHAHENGIETLEEYTVVPPRSHLPSVDWLQERLCEEVAESEVDEHCHTDFCDAIGDPDVAALIDSLLDAICKSVNYRMAEDLVAVHHRALPPEDVGFRMGCHGCRLATIRNRNEPIPCAAHAPEPADA